MRRFFILTAFTCLHADTSKAQEIATNSSSTIKINIQSVDVKCKHPLSMYVADVKLQYSLSTTQKRIKRPVAVVTMLMEDKNGRRKIRRVYSVFVEGKVHQQFGSWGKVEFSKSQFIEVEKFAPAGLVKVETDTYFPDSWLGRDKMKIVCYIAKVYSDENTFVSKESQFLQMLITRKEIPENWELPETYPDFSRSSAP